MRSIICGVVYLLIVVVASACTSEPEFSGVGITVKNDIREPEFDVIEVSASGGARSAGRLGPGERLNIKGQGKIFLTFRRRYSDHTRVYKVECPDISSRVKIKLIDVHLNKMAGGCKLVQYYKG